MFDAHDERRAISRARAKDGKIIAAKMEMMAMTVKISIKVNAARREWEWE